MSNVGLLRKMVTHATIADYYCKGIETALLPPEEAIAWADSIIATLDEPPYEFIEVALSDQTSSLIAALKRISDEPDQDTVGAWLFNRIQDANIDSVENFASALRKAMLVCRHCGMRDEIYYELDGIDDSLYLARHGQYGSVEECRSDFQAVLQRYARPYLRASEAQPGVPADRLRRPLN